MRMDLLLNKTKLTIIIEAWLMLKKVCIKHNHQAEQDITSINKA